MKNIKSAFITTLIVILFLTSCQSNWEIAVKEGERKTGSIDASSVSFYIEKSLDEVTEIPLGQMLYDVGYTLIKEISIVAKNGDAARVSWEDIAETAAINASGEIILEDGSTYQPVEIQIEPNPLLSSIDISIKDISATIAYALGLPELHNADGSVLFDSDADHAVMILLDGTQYQKLTSLVNAGELPFLKKNATIQMGLTVYPPITTSASAALLTGLPPRESGVFGYGYRTTESQTLFDLASQEGKSVIAIEGNSLPFNLQSAETTLSGDRDENGYYDDNVFENALVVIQSNMPDLLYIHFHEIDDMGHTYGPDSPEYQSAIQRVDGFLEEIYQALPENTLIAIFADHGMHATEEGGNHGALLASDLIIPIIFLKK
jgi:hypothetical protein